METTETTPTQKHYAIPRYRVCVVREKFDALVAEPPKRLTDSRQVYHALRPHFADAACEEFVMICLDAKHAPIGWHIVSIGSLTLSIVHPREVFKVAVAMNSAAIILAHNHPSGEPTPSQEDRVLTQRLVEGKPFLTVLATNKFGSCRMLFLHKPCLNHPAPIANLCFSTPSGNRPCGD